MAAVIEDADFPVKTEEYKARYAWQLRTLSGKVFALVREELTYRLISYKVLNHKWITLFMTVTLRNAYWRKVNLTATMPVYATPSGDES